MQRVQEFTAVRLSVAIAENGFHHDDAIRVHQPAGFGDHRVARVEPDFDKLHAFALDSVVYFVKLRNGAPRPLPT